MGSPEWCLPGVLSGAEQADERRELFERRIIAELAERVCQRLTRKDTAKLQRMRDGLQSGEDSGLVSIWEEICVQIQGQQSIFWEMYDDIVCDLIEAELEKLPDFERKALWLQTEEGQDWDAEEEADVVSDHIISYLATRIYGRAADWSNRRIRCFQERDFEFD